MRERILFLAFDHFDNPGDFALRSRSIAIHPEYEYECFGHRHFARREAYGLRHSHLLRETVWLPGRKSILYWHAPVIPTNLPVPPTISIRPSPEDPEVTSPVFLVETV